MATLSRLKRSSIRRSSRSTCTGTAKCASSAAATRPRPDLSGTSRELTLKDHAMLVIRRSVAGFPEKLVPNIIAKVETNVEQTATPKS